MLGEYCTEVLKNPGFPLLLDRQYLWMNITIKGYKKHSHISFLLCPSCFCGEYVGVCCYFGVLTARESSY